MSGSSIGNITYRTMRAGIVAALAVIAIVFACPRAWTQQSGSGMSESTATYTPTEQPKGKAFSKPGMAAAALFAAAKRNDEAEILVVLGPNAKEIIQWSDDPAERREHREMFVHKYEQMHRLVKEPDNTVALYVGSENWPLPVPLVEYHGAWYFDADLGCKEVLYRRIGDNEMQALEVSRTLVDAEKEYRAMAHQYTAKFVSADSSHDGLYWKSSSDATRSPIGAYLAQAGVAGPDTTHSQAFHGYYYRILLQGTDGFSIVAFPAEYRSSGVMTFVLSQDGAAHEKDLGEQTAQLAAKDISSHVDNSWKPVE